MYLFLNSQIFNLWYLEYFGHNCFEAVKEFYKLWFWSKTTFEDIKLPLPQHNEHWKTGQYRKSVDHGEISVNADLNQLDSGKLWQSTTVSRQGEWLP